MSTVSCGLHARTAQKGESFFNELTDVSPIIAAVLSFRNRFLKKLNIKDETEPSDWSAAADGGQNKDLSPTAAF